MKLYNYNSKTKKGIYYTMDALISSMLLLMALLIIFLTYDEKIVNLEQKVFLTQDILTILSTTQIYEINNSFIIAELSNNNISNINNTILEQMGEYWALNETDKASQLFQSIIPQGLIENVGLRVTIDDEEIYFKNYTTKNDLLTFNRMLSGVIKDAPLTGYTSSAYLKKIRDKKSTSYYYFGGFIGQGNISFFIDDLPSEFDSSKITNIYLEGMFEKNFTLKINGVLCDSSESSPGVKLFVPTPSTEILSSWNLTQCNSSITTPITNFTLIFNATNVSNSFVAGGLLRISYRTDVLQQNFTLGEDRYYFPEIFGIANIYDSFYIPGNLETMNARIHFNSSQQTYLTIGERIINLDANGTDQVVILNDSFFLSQGFNYAQLSNNTVPIRFASYNATTTIVIGGDADVILITDFTASMKKSTSDWDQGNLGSTCANAYTDPDIRRTKLAQCLGNEFVNTLLNYSGNRIWPVMMYNDGAEWYNNPTDASAINGYINSFPNGKGNTCTACALNLAYEILKNNSNSNRSKFIVFMSDGVPTHCAQGSCTSNSTNIGTVSCTGLCDTNGACDVSNIPTQCTNCTNTIGPRTNAYYSLNRSVRELNVSVYTIGFGPVSDCPLCNETMSIMAGMGNGTYQSSSNVSALRLIYQNISQEILERVEQSNQSVVLTGNLTASKLYGDSYIHFTFDPLVSSLSPGKISFTTQIALENCSSKIYIPSGLEIIDAKVISYSGEHWSDILVVNNVTVFNLSSYYVPYYKLGDPTVIQIPVSYLINGNNTIFIETGDSDTNRTNCSEYNSLIYTALIPSATSRTSVEENNVGCTWTVQYADGDLNTVSVPTNYNGTKTCSYMPGNISYDTTDTYDVATHTLFKQLDTENTGTVLVNINNLDLEIITTVISGVPYLWGPAIMRIEAWQ